MIASRQNDCILPSDSAPVCPVCDMARCRKTWSLELPGHPIAFRLWQCRSCNVVFNHPRLTPDQVRDQYDGEYYVFNEPPERRWGRATQLYLEHLLPLETHGPGRRLLEVGCAGGELLALARWRGWDVLGVEISPQAAQAARQNHGLPVLAGTLEENAGTIGTFDVAIANDVIEHVLSPRAFLQTLHSILRPQGRLSLETPNWGGVWRRVGGPRWLGINRFHIFLFDARSLTKLMKECGFTNCVARSSTNLAYSSWACRPEIGRLTQRLPAALRWRCTRWADRLTPRGQALELFRNPPASLEQALARIAAMDSPELGNSSSLTGDNLQVIGRA